MVYIGPLISIKGDQQQKFADKRIGAKFTSEAQTDEAVVTRVL